QLFRKV
ncbi:hypothetical protein ECFRIK1999_3030, partial [Escherichia coli FRIK1999]